MKKRNFNGKERISVLKVVTFLNKLLRQDHELVQTMFRDYYKCNKKTRDHKTIQVCCHGKFSKKNPACRVLGVINGMFGIDADGISPIAMNIDEDGYIVSFSVVTKIYKKRNFQIK